MSLRDQRSAFNKRGAARRREIYGDAFTLGGKPYCGAFAAFTSTREQQVGGWSVDIRAVIRVARAAYPTFTPEFGAILTLTETGGRHEISEIRNSPRSPEWVIGLINPQEAQDA